jgi:NAD(P)-dependent dehydrogenase (short-subunit alcohol dehydrogenase family)
MGIEQKVAVIAGASRGVGAAFVRAYCDRNYRVVTTARSQSAGFVTGEILHVDGGQSAGH